MAKKRQSGKNIHNNSTATKPPAFKKGEKHIHQHSDGTRQSKASTPKWMVPVILIVTFLAYIPALRAGFVEWDDPDYVLKNMLIRDFSNLGKLIITPLQGNYHPLTMISIAVNYALSGLDAWSYHLLNVILHLVNCFLVFKFVMLLANRNVIIAFTTALLFGIHPLHVESVAWISERKDVLYTVFFMAGLISYTKYVDTNSKKQYWYTLLFLALSLLSKPAAVVFPAVLFCIDLYKKRQLNLKLIIEKIPFGVLALIMGLTTYFAQTDVGAVGAAMFSMDKRIFFGFYGIMMYIVKMLLPFNLSPFYPYPPINEPLPGEYLFSPVIFLALAVLVFITWKKTRVIAFGAAFYLLNLLLVLQFFPVGSAVIADRYTYMPYIGLFFIIGWLINRYAQSRIAKANYILLPVSAFFVILTFRQSGVWKDSVSLWDQAIKTQPSSKAYTIRGKLYGDEGNTAMAFQYYNEAIKMNLIEQDAYTNRANIYFNQQKYDLAYADYKKSLSIKYDNAPALDNMSALYATLGKFDSALLVLNRAITLKPDYFPAYRNRALVHLNQGNYDNAISDYRILLQYEPNNADAYNFLGYCLRMQKKYNEALPFMNKAIQINPNPVFYTNRAFCYLSMNNLALAKKDALKAKELGTQIDPLLANLIE